ncbi:hypothetical protein LXL04_029740 [Taraxacum kok-saghyz]
MEVAVCFSEGLRRWRWSSDLFVRFHGGCRCPEQQQIGERVVAGERKEWRRCRRLRWKEGVGLGYPHDAPATVLIGKWFRSGKPSDQQFLFERTVSRVILFICLDIRIIRLYRHKGIVEGGKLSCFSTCVNKMEGLFKRTLYRYRYIAGMEKR